MQAYLEESLFHTNYRHEVSFHYIKGRREQSLHSPFGEKAFIAGGLRGAMPCCGLHTEQSPTAQKLVSTPTGCPYKGWKQPEKPVSANELLIYMAQFFSWEKKYKTQLQLLPALTGEKGEKESLLQNKVNHLYPSILLSYICLILQGTTETPGFRHTVAML